MTEDNGPRGAGRQACRTMLWCALLLAPAVAGCLAPETSETMVPPAPSAAPATTAAEAAPTAMPPAATTAESGPAPAGNASEDGPAPYTQSGTLQDSLLVGYFWAHQDDGGFTNEGIDQNKHPLPLTGSAPDGAPIGATRFNITLEPPNPTFDHPPQNLNLYLLDPTGEILAKSADETWTDPMHWGAEQIVWETAPLPAGDYVMQVVLYFGVGAEWPYTLSWTVEYDPL